MKKSLIAAFMLVIAGKTFAATADTLTVTTQPQMHCENCEKKIKSNIRFVRVRRKSKLQWTTRRSPSSTTHAKPSTTTSLRRSRKSDMR